MPPHLLTVFQSLPFKLLKLTAASMHVHLSIQGEITSKRARKTNCDISAVQYRRSLADQLDFVTTAA
jgi:hypothetical protein